MSKPVSKAKILKAQKELAKQVGEPIFYQIFAPERVVDIALGYRLKQILHRRVKAYCALHGITYQDFLVRALQEKLEDAKEESDGGRDG